LHHLINPTEDKDDGRNWNEYLYYDEDKFLGQLLDRLDLCHEDDTLAQPLDNREYFGRLRLTCRQVYVRTFSTYKAKVLGQSWMMGENSPDTLTAIADDDRFRSKFGHLSINTHYLFVDESQNDDAKKWSVYFARKQIGFLAGA